MIQLSWQHNAEIILNQLTLLLINSAPFFLLYVDDIDQNMILFVRSSCFLKYAEIYSSSHLAHVQKHVFVTFG